MTFGDTPLSASCVSTRLFSANRAFASSSAASSASDCTFALASMMSSMLSGAVVACPQDPYTESLVRRYRRSRTSALPSMTVACESTHCPFASSVMPETVRFGRFAHVELDRREQPLAVARPVAGLRAAAVSLRQRLRRAVGDDGLLEDVLAVDRGRDGDAESSRWPHAHHGARGHRRRQCRAGPARSSSIPGMGSSASRTPPVIPAPSPAPTRAARARRRASIYVS